MFKKIYKYNIKLGIPNTEKYANDAKIVLFGTQGGEFFIWVEVDQNDALYRENLPERTFIIIATGAEVHSSWVHHFSIQDGLFVWHLYEVK